MNPEVKAKWVKALRSGDYKQGRNQLRSEDRFCCLGVLCNLHAHEFPSVAKRQKEQDQYEGENKLPPKNVTRWAGLPFDPDDVVGALAEMNDGGKTFRQIADYIEREL